MSTSQMSSQTTKKVKVQAGNGLVLEFGGKSIPLIAGPCSIESAEQFRLSAEGVSQAGASMLRGGIFKMRTNPSSFQGMGASSFSFINDVKHEFSMPFVSEVTDPRQINDLLGLVDMFQVGSRNMYNYALLKELGATKTPVMLKRGFSATVEEWLLAADYIVKGGNENVVLCERGIRSFETTTRNTLDLNSVAYIKQHSSFPVIVDPSHGTGRPELIGPMALAGIACGADGIMIEVHPNPRESLSDAYQALNFAQFAEIASQSRKVALAIGREITQPFAQPVQTSFSKASGQNFSQVNKL